MSTLINNIETLKANFSGIDANFTWASIQSYIEDVERDIIADAIGDDALAYFAGNPTLDNTIFQKALNLMKRAEAYLGILKWSQTALFRLTDKALYVAKSSDGVIISDKKLRDLRNYCEESGFIYLDKALGLMESNLDLFTSYAESGTRQTLLKCFIKTAADFNVQRSIDNSRVTLMSITGIMFDAQEEFLPEIMGDNFYQTFKEKFLDDELSPDELKLLPLIKKALAFLTISQACKDLPVKVGAKGLLINRYNDTKEYDQADPADPARIQFMVDDNLEKGERKLNDLQNYLVKNAALYPLYVPPVALEVTVNDDHCSGFYMM